MKYYVVDTFTDSLFRGNPAGVCLPERDLSDVEMQHVAFENNLAETAFLRQKDGEYVLRWFTPKTEIDLCGHATLATAFVLMQEIGLSDSSIIFNTKSGPLNVTRRDHLYVMDFPRRKPDIVAPPARLNEAVGGPVKEVCQSRDLLVRVASEEQVRHLSPDMPLIGAITAERQCLGLIITAPGQNCDFVSRFFAPNAGVDEDPVTGSSHSSLIPFWSERLGKTVLTAQQLSPRGGTLFCEDCGKRVKIGGQAVCYLRGHLNL